MKTNDVSTKAQAITLRDVGLSQAEVTKITGVSERQQRRYWTDAKARGWSPKTPLLNIHVAERPRPGRPKTFTAEEEKALVEKATEEGVSIKQLAGEKGVCKRTVSRVIKDHRKATQANGIRSTAKVKATQDDEDSGAAKDGFMEKVTPSTGATMSSAAGRNNTTTTSELTMLHETHSQNAKQTQHNITMHPDQLHTALDGREQQYYSVYPPIA